MIDVSALPVQPTRVEASIRLGDCAGSRTFEVEDVAAYDGAVPPSLPDGRYWFWAAAYEGDALLGAGCTPQLLPTEADTVTTVVRPPCPAEPCPEGNRCAGGVCVVTICGDGVLDPSEGCDDGNLTSGDGCDGLCRSEMDGGTSDGGRADGGPRFDAGTCGNGTVEAGEDCDDGNLVDDDLCDSTCRGFRYRAAVTFDAPVSRPDYPLLVILETTTFDYTHADAAGDDLRFGSESALYDQWIERWDPTGSGISRVWVSAPTVVGPNTIYVYYGHTNPGLLPRSDEASVFDPARVTRLDGAQSGPITDDRVLVESGATVGPAAEQTELRLEAAWVEITGAIAAAGAGFDSQMGPGAGSSSTDGGGGGGGHGGSGGDGGGAIPGVAGGIYGDSTDLTRVDPGSGGGGGGGSDPGGAGGGAVVIRAQRLVIPAGVTIDARGETPSTRGAGGGAGGGVLFTACSMTVSADVHVDGGDGSGFSTAGAGGGGGGGRISIGYGADAQLLTTQMTTLGGFGASSVAGAGQDGGPGVLSWRQVPELCPTIGPEQALF